MKILYGVNGVGSGHITRARIMAKELKKAGHEVQFLFSGRCISEYYDMEIFGDAWYRKGLTFVIESGKVNKIKTFLNADFTTFLHDIDHLCLDDFDLIISDYEPIVCWAAKCKKKECIGIGHQYAFDYDIPKSHSNFFLNTFMKWYAPVSLGIGLHWHHFGQPILPPIIDTPRAKKAIPNKILVYLPFEDDNDVLNLLAPFEDYEFYVYGFYGLCCSERPNIHFKNPSRDGFQCDLADCNGVICNAGFELPSEALHLGKKLLVKAVEGQMEQHSNAEALSELGYGWTTDQLTVATVESFLHSPQYKVQVTFPNVAAYIVNWLNDTSEPIKTERVWNCVKIDVRA